MRRRRSRGWQRLCRRRVVGPHRPGPAAAFARGFAGEAGAPRGWRRQDGVRRRPGRGVAEPAVAPLGAVSPTPIDARHLAMLRRLPEAAREQDVTLRPDRSSERGWQRLCRRRVVGPHRPGPAAAFARGFAGEAGAPRGWRRQDGVRRRPGRGVAEPAVAPLAAVSLTPIEARHLAMLRRLPEAAGEQDVTLRPDRLSERGWQRLCRRRVVAGVSDRKRQRSRLAQALE